MIPTPQCLLSPLWKNSMHWSIFSQDFHPKKSKDQPFFAGKSTIVFWDSLNQPPKAAPQPVAVFWLKNPSFLKRVYLPMMLVEVRYHPHTKASNGGEVAGGKRNIQGSFRKKTEDVYGILEMYEQRKWSF